MNRRTPVGPSLRTVVVHVSASSKLSKKLFANLGQHSTGTGYSEKHLSMSSRDYRRNDAYITRLSPVDSRRAEFAPVPVKKKVLFICVHNSARSQMAEAWLNEICGDYFEAHSAGLEPGQLNPLAIEAMREVGIDISGKKTQAVFDVFKSGELFAYVVTVCDESSAEKCPIFPGVTNRLHWSFPDPSALTGTYQQRLEAA